MAVKGPKPQNPNVGQKVGDREVLENVTVGGVRCVVVRTEVCITLDAWRRFVRKTKKKER